MEDRDRVVGVVGLGYVGLPLAVAFAEAGTRVFGLDSSPERVALIREGTSPIDDVSDERLHAVVGGLMQVSEPTSELIAECDAVVVCVPTPIDRAKVPDLESVRGAAAMIALGIRHGQLIILQSTTYPGTTTGPFREELESTGLRAGEDFDLAYAPERISPGDPSSATRTTPRIVGGTTGAATDRARRLLLRVSDHVLPMSSPDAAEMAKLHENVFRNVNIALVNQLALLCERMGIDVWEVVDAASTKPFGFMRFTPGPGVGGHCIPVDPYYLAWRAREFDFVDRFVETAADVNLAMPRHVVELVAEALNQRGRSLRGARVGVIGVAFKPNVADARNAPAAAIVAMMRERGAEVYFHDPHVPRFADAAGVVSDSVPLPLLLETTDVVLVVTAHREVDWDAVFSGAGLIVDTVNVSKGREAGDRQVLRLGARWGTQRSPVEDARIVVS